jgi:hypothetical protein
MSGYLPAVWLCEFHSALKQHSDTQQPRITIVSYEKGQFQAIIHTAVKSVIIPQKSIKQPQVDKILVGKGGEIQTSVAEVTVDAVDSEEGERETGVDDKGHNKKAASTTSKPTSVKQYEDAGIKLPDEGGDEVGA